MSNEPSSAKVSAQSDNSAWKEIVARYQQSSVPRATWQILNTLVPYAGLWVAMFFLKSVS